MARVSSHEPMAQVSSNKSIKEEQLPFKKRKTYHGEFKSDSFTFFHNADSSKKLDVVFEIKSIFSTGAK
tara:strand:- start:168 stop:374 length:207 start_codon:yes stop_codon:yes gene_type:complete